MSDIPGSNAHAIPGANGHMKSLYESRLFVDLELILRDGTKLSVHKAIVCRCPFFKAACSGNFKEAQENTIHFPEDSPNALQGVVMWLYGFDLKDCYMNGAKIYKAAQRAPVRAVVLPQMYDLAAKYDLPELVEAITSFLLQHHTSSCRSTPSFEIWHWPMAQYLWTNLDSATALRPILLEFYRSHVVQSSDDDHKSRMAKHLRECPELALDLLLSGGLDGKGLKYLENA